MPRWCASNPTDPASIMVRGASPGCQPPAALPAARRTGYGVRSAAEAGGAQELLEVAEEGRGRGYAELGVQADDGGALVAGEPEVDLGGTGMRPQHLAELFYHGRDAPVEGEFNHERAGIIR